MRKYDANLKYYGFFTSYILLLFLMIKGLQSMASSVEYKNIKYLK